ncbi:MAG TPA: hypothetical protein VKU00_15490 [Chthonomonadaceae bacterium]|nr:hypothetical protein [Chthonomonadaceae bacterium]
MNRRKLGPPPDWIRSEGPGEAGSGEPADPLKGIFSASRSARLGEQEEDSLLTAFRERREGIPEAQVLAEVKALLTAERKRAEPFSEVHISPAGTTDVGDVRNTRLVILAPNHVHTGEVHTSLALKKAQALLSNYGVGRRRYRNTLLFLAPDALKMQELLDDMCSLLAWQSLIETPGMRLEPRAAERARNHLQRCLELRERNLREAFSWLLVPTQSQPDAPMEWREIRLSFGEGALAEGASRALIEQGLLRTDEGLADELGRVRAWLPDPISNPVHLAEEFARHLYLPRILDERILYNVLKTVLTAGMPARTNTRRPFTATLRLDPSDLAASGILAPELLAPLLAVANPGDLKLTLHIEALVSEAHRRQLESALAEMQSGDKAAVRSTPPKP